MQGRTTENLDTTVVGLRRFPISNTTPTSGQVLTFDGTNWTPATPPPRGSDVGTGPTPPPNPQQGDLWWDDVGGQLYVYYNDGTSSQWVQANTGKLGATGPAGPVGPQGPQGIPGPTTPIPGVTDGSNAPAGMVGEFLTAQNLIQPFNMSAVNSDPVGLQLTAGDWQVSVYYSVAFTTGSAIPNVGTGAYFQCQGTWTNIDGFNQAIMMVRCAIPLLTFSANNGAIYLSGPVGPGRMSNNSGNRITGNMQFFGDGITSFVPQSTTAYIMYAARRMR